MENESYGIGVELCFDFDAFCSYGGLSVCGSFRMASKVLVLVIKASG